ncbi:MAG: hypothetical protein DHS20C16_11270 [Phycisphaerae bacterium]|nr:MAG: hypothetical protein DHS20C16_11270 [Phycisphaerae bacterium]
MFSKDQIDELFDLKVPSGYRKHKLVDGQVYYTFPLDLLCELVKHCTAAAFDASLLSMEQDLASELKHNPRFVGYDAAGDVLSHEYLSKESLPLPNPNNELLKRHGKTRAGYNQFLDEAEALLAPGRNALRGYTGWLITNPRYLAERDRLLNKWKRQIAVDGIPRHGTAWLRNADKSSSVRQIQKGRRLECLNDFTGFYRRWRLQHLITNDLPVPLSSKVTDHGVLEGSALMDGGGVSMWQPDTLPISPGDQLNVMLNDMRINGNNEHLDEWINDCSKTGSNNHTIKRYCAVLTVRFYWNLLQARHPDVFNRRKGKVIAAFGDYLGLGPRPVQSVIQLINQRTKM